MDLEARMEGGSFVVDPMKVFEVLNKIVSIIKIQMMRDRYTTPESSFATLTRMLSLKQEEDRHVEGFLIELLELLRKPQNDKPVIKKIAGTLDG